MKRYLLILFLLNPLFVRAIMLSEIMYAPLNGTEYLEIYATTNLSGCKVSDLTKNQTLELTHWSSNPYQLVALPGAYQNVSNITRYEVPKIGNGLNNDGDSVFIWCNGTLLASTTFYGSVANRNGKSISWKDGAWYESVPTPGRENEFEEIAKENETSEKQTLELSITLLDKILAYYTYTRLIRIDNNGPPATVSWEYALKKNGTVIIKGNETREINKWTTANTGQLKVTTAGEFVFCARILGMNQSCKNITAIDTTNDPCNVSVVLQNPLIIHEGNPLTYNITLTNSSVPFQATYWINDQYNETIRASYTTSVPGTKRYTPKGENMKLLEIGVNLDFLACKTNGSRKATAYAVYVPDERQAEVHIEQVYLGTDKKATAGETIRVLVSARRGESKTSTLKLYAESQGKQASEIVRFNLEKHESISVTVPIRIEKGKEEGKIILDGFGSTDERTFEIKDEPVISEQETEEETKPLEILSLYTRNRKYSELITLRGRTSLNTSTEIYEVRYLGTVTEMDFELPVNVSKPNTTIMAVTENKGTKDYKMLALNLEHEKTQTNKTPDDFEEIQVIPTITSYTAPSRSVLSYAPYAIGLLALLGIALGITFK
ncbi:MAG: hypothetical protein ABIA93_01245 [Candidatus Woesearchaeota archaeon]